MILYRHKGCPGCDFIVDAYDVKSSTSIQVYSSYFRRESRIFYILKCIQLRCVHTKGLDVLLCLSFKHIEYCKSNLIYIFWNRTYFKQYLITLQVKNKINKIKSKHSYNMIWSMHVWALTFYIIVEKKKKIQVNAHLSCNIHIHVNGQFFI